MTANAAHKWSLLGIAFKVRVELGGPEIAQLSIQRLAGAGFYFGFLSFVGRTVIVVVVIVIMIVQMVPNYANFFR